jgi:mannitol/fructose-specific phosphotransferase system IIA component (Ntr-type)
VNVSSILSPSSCSVSLAATDTATAIDSLASLVAGSVDELSQDEIRRGLLERESAISTGYDHAVALPHCKAVEIERFSMAIAVAPDGVPFRAGSSEPTRFFLTLVGPSDRPDEYINLLAAIAQFSMDPEARRRMLEANTPHQLHAIFQLYPHPPLVEATVASRD